MSKEMKRMVVTLIALLLLAGCATIPQAGDETPLPSVSQTPSPGPKSLSDTQNQTPAPTTESGGATQTGGDSPQLDWDRSSQALILSATHCCGFVPEIVATNYIPEAQLWGDGRMIWVERGEDGERRVLETMLSEDQVVDLLRKITSAGFFDWKELYTSQQSPTDLPSKCLAVNLESRSHRVCEYYEGAPPAFHEAFSEFANGLGQSGSNYTPKTGFLIARSIQVSQGDQIEGVELEWDPGLTGLSLNVAAEGVWVDGPALQAAWQAVNKGPLSNLVKEGEAFYQLSLQIPGLSMVGPR